LKQAVKSKIDEFLAELNKPAKAAPQDEALRLAQLRAALPPSQGGLGLPANNTPEQRAKAMSWNTPGFHATNANIKKFDPNLYGASDYGSIGQGVYIDPSKSAGYANLVASIVGKDKPANVMPLLVREGNVFNADQLPLITNAKTSKEVSKNLKKLGYDSVMSEVNGQPNEMVVFDPDRVRSRFAAFDPFRRDAATAALFGVAAPDLLAQEQEKAAGGEVHMAEGGDTMLAELMERYNTPRNKSRYSAGIFDNNAPGEVRSVTPTVKERIASGLQAAMEAAGSDRYKARQRAQTIVGGPNSRLPGGFGVADIGAMVNPVVAAGMMPLYGEEAIRNLANVPNALKRGDYVGAGVDTAFGLMDLIPAVGQGKKVVKDVAKGIKNAVTSNAGYDLAQKILNATGASPRQIMAYQGSPHLYAATPNNPLGELDPTKIGSGEGAQAYGMGHYLAENRNVGEGYRNSISSQHGQDVTVGGIPVDEYYMKVYGNADQLPLEEARQQYDKAALIEMLSFNRSPNDILSYAEDMGYAPSVIDWFKTDVIPQTKMPGYLYTHDLSDEAIARMLDWDKPLSQQSQHVKDALEKSDYAFRDMA